MDETQTEPQPIKKTIKEIMKEADIQDNRIVCYNYQFNRKEGEQKKQ